MKKLINIFANMAKKSKTIKDTTTTVIEKSNCVVYNPSPLPQEYGGYKPLPNNLKLEKSGIEGYGVVAKYFINNTTTIGKSHIMLNSGELVRTPLGGYINHSNEPNCIIEKVKVGRGGSEGSHWYLISTRDIEIDEELTLDYSKNLCKS